MKLPSVAPRRRAQDDINDALRHYLDEGGVELALRFIDALETAFAHLRNHPSSGSPRYATLLDLPGLRTRPLHRFPYLLFYVEIDGGIDVWRVLHDKRDIPASLQDDWTPNG